MGDFSTHSLSSFAKGLVVNPVPLLVLRRAVQHHAAAGAPLEVGSRFRLVETLDAHGERPHFVLELGLIHPLLALTPLAYYRAAGRCSSVFERVGWFLISEVERSSSREGENDTGRYIYIYADSCLGSHKCLQQYSRVYTRVFRFEGGDMPRCCCFPSRTHTHTHTNT